jgi:NADH-quinone oxidoreductase subunit A
MMALWPLGLYAVLVVIIAGSMLAISYVLGERHMERFTGVPYEGGIKPEGSARVRFSPKFYLVAVFFVIFDLESVFLVVYAVVARQMGWIGYAEAMVFIGILLAALAYLWRLGALDWGPATGWRTRQF